MPFLASFGQIPTNISGTIVDENGNPISKATIYISDDTAYTGKRGRFKVAYPNPQQFWYSFRIEKSGFLSKTFFVGLSSKDIKLVKPFIIRSRKGFWYNSRVIDSSHLGITVRQAISKYKLAIDECLLWDEPPGSYHNFTTELSDSSYIRFTFKGIFTKDKRLKMSDVLDRIITGIGIGFTDGTVREFGNGHARENPYFVERQMKMGK